MKHKINHTSALILAEGEGRVYNCGTMTAIFKADENETREKQEMEKFYNIAMSTDSIIGSISFDYAFLSNGKIIQ